MSVIKKAALGSFMALPAERRPEYPDAEADPDSLRILKKDMRRYDELSDVVFKLVRPGSLVYLYDVASREMPDCQWSDLHRDEAISACDIHARPEIWGFDIKPEKSLVVSRKALLFVTASLGFDDKIAIRGAGSELLTRAFSRFMENEGLVSAGWAMGAALNVGNEFHLSDLIVSEMEERTGSSYVYWHSVDQDTGTPGSIFYTMDRNEQVSETALHIMVACTEAGRRISPLRLVVERPTGEMWRSAASALIEANNLRGYSI